MNRFDRTMLGITLFAFALSMLAISLDAFNMAGVKYANWTLILLGIVAGLAMLVCLIIGFIVLFTKRR